MTATLLLNLPFGEDGGAAYAQISVTALPKIQAGGYHIKCNGGTDGEINTVVTGNVGPCTFLWNTSATSNSITGRTAGMYWVTVTDSLNNTASDTVTLVQPGVLTAGISAHTFGGGTHISEHGASDGDMFSNVGGGIPPYTYLWGPGDHTENNYKARPAGDYTLLVTDAGGCTAQAQQTLTEPEQLSVTVIWVEKAGGYHVSNCERRGGRDGQAEAQVAGGVPPYTFMWSSSEMDQQATRLDAGEQYVKVTDANGAMVDAGFEMTTPEPIDVEVTLNDLYPNGYHVSCHDCSNATLTATVTGGVEPFAYFWHKGQQNGTATLTNAGNAIYSLMVVDAMGCKAMSDIIKLRIPERDDWSVNGNPGLDAEGNPKWLGTSDENDLMLKSNNQPMLRVGADGNVDVMGQLRLPGLAGSGTLLVADQDGKIGKAEDFDFATVIDSVVKISDTLNVNPDQGSGQMLGIEKSGLFRALGACDQPLWRTSTLSAAEEGIDIHTCETGSVRIGGGPTIMWQGENHPDYARARLHLHSTTNLGSKKNLALSREGLNSEFRLWISKNTAQQNVMLIDAMTMTGGQFGAGTMGLTIQQNGNIGMGTYTPDSRLAVTGNISISGNRLHVNASNGRVGIGTATPEVQLEVAHNQAAGGIVINRTGSQADSKSEIRFSKNSDARFAMGIDLGNNGQQTFFIWDHLAASGTGAPRFIINGNGKVGIGTDPPMDGTIYKLYVEGGIKTRDVKAQANGWGDFVFESAYNLMPIDELARQIEILGHLPGIPSVQEVTVEDGFEVGDMVKRLLIKVEEQTLYIIGLKKEIDELKAKDRK